MNNLILKKKEKKWNILWKMYLKIFELITYICF